MAKKAKAKVNDKAFNLMTAVADKTNVDVLAKGKESSIKGIHNALLAAGMTPAYGNIADVADATLYALEGEFGEAAWSMAAAIPVIGQMVTGRRAIKAAKEAGEEMVTLYRGVPKWFKGSMVKKGKFLGYKRGYGHHGLWASNSMNVARRYSTRAERMAPKYRKYVLGKDVSKPTILEFEVPKSYVKEYSSSGLQEGGKSFIFKDGIPKEFLKKVHK